ncbi:hypothetical protein NC651_037373 [Populus alba x Populus x berolinensis]|nr:hypothetical protein NC651_037373 [Populus alba x Populus x berolinensis]
MMAVGRDSKDLIGPLLAVNLVFFLVVLGLAGWSVDKYINGEQNHPHLGGNPATIFMLIYALISGVIGASSMLVGFVHLRAWRNDSLASASAMAIISWAITALAFGFECKQILLGGHRGERLKALEALIIISLLSQFLYVVVLHAGFFRIRYGPGYHNCGSDSVGDIPVGNEPHMSST